MSMQSVFVSGALHQISHVNMLGICNLTWFLFWTLALFIFRPSYCHGDHTFQVPMSLFAENRKRLRDQLSKIDSLPEKSIVLLQGGEQKMQDATDRELVFRQVNVFFITMICFIFWWLQVLQVFKIRLFKIRKVFFITSGRTEENYEVSLACIIRNRINLITC